MILETREATVILWHRGALYGEMFVIDEGIGFQVRGNDLQLSLALHDDKYEFLGYDEYIPKQLEICKFRNLYLL